MIIRQRVGTMVVHLRCTPTPMPSTTAVAGIQDGSNGQGEPAETGVTWINAATLPLAAWSTPGGDFNSTDLATVPTGNHTGPLTFAESPALLAAVLRWHANVGLNRGVVIMVRRGWPGDALFCRADRIYRVFP